MYGGHWNILPSNSLASVIIYSPAFNIHKDMYEDKKRIENSHAQRDKGKSSKRALLFYQDLSSSLNTSFKHFLSLSEKKSKLT